MRYLWKYAERWNAVLEKKRLMNSWESVGDCCLIVHCLLFWYSAADPWGAGIHQAAVPDDFNVARGVCDFAGAGMADIRSLTVENRNMSYL